MAWASYKRLTSRRQWGFAAARDGDGEAAKSHVLIHAIHGRELQRTAHSVQHAAYSNNRGDQAEDSFPRCVRWSPYDEPLFLICFSRHVSVTMS